MAQKLRQYDPEFRIQAVKLAQEMGSAAAAARELGISKNTLYTWMKKVRDGDLDRHRETVLLCSLDMTREDQDTQGPRHVKTRTQESLRPVSVDNTKGPSPCVRPGP